MRKRMRFPDGSRPEFLINSRPLHCERETARRTGIFRSSFHNSGALRKSLILERSSVADSNFQSPNGRDLAGEVQNEPDGVKLETDCKIYVARIFRNCRTTVVFWVVSCTRERG